MAVFIRGLGRGPQPYRIVADPDGAGKEHSPSTGKLLPLFANLHPVLFNHRIGQNVTCHIFQGSGRLLFGCPVGEVNLKILALPHRSNFFMPQAVQGVANRLPLRIEHCMFHPDVNMSFHEFSFYEASASSSLFSVCSPSARAISATSALAGRGVSMKGVKRFLVVLAVVIVLGGLGYLIFAGQRRLQAMDSRIADMNARVIEATQLAKEQAVAVSAAAQQATRRRHAPKSPPEAASRPKSKKNRRRPARRKLKRLPAGRRNKHEQARDPTRDAAQAARRRIEPDAAGAESCG